MPCCVDSICWAVDLEDESFGEVRVGKSRCVSKAAFAYIPSFMALSQQGIEIFIIGLTLHKLRGSSEGASRLALCWGGLEKEAPELMKRLSQDGEAFDKSVVVTEKPGARFKFL